MSILGFLKGATNILGGVLKNALPLVEAILPVAQPVIGVALGPYGAIANAAINVIISAEEKHKQATASAAQAMIAAPALGGSAVSVASGVMQEIQSQKKADVMTNLDLMSPLISALIRKPIIDPARLVKGVDQIVEGLVDVLKAVGDLPSTPQINPAVVSMPSSGNAAAPAATGVKIEGM